MTILTSGTATADRVNAALKEAGYFDGSPEVKAEPICSQAYFLGVNDWGSEVHHVVYNDKLPGYDDDCPTGKVYVWFDKAKGKLVAEW